MAKVPFRGRKKPKIRADAKCPLCEAKKTPDYKEVDTLSQFITDRGEIISRARSGVCAKHQRKLSQQIKRARFLALLPFLSKVKK